MDERVHGKIPGIHSTSAVGGQMRKRMPKEEAIIISIHNLHLLFVSHLSGQGQANDLLGVITANTAID
jgi:hypothetical protein